MNHSSHHHHLYNNNNATTSFVVSSSSSLPMPGLLNKNQQGGEEEVLIDSEYYFYFCNGIFGSLMNLVVLQIGWFRMDTYDKPRQIFVLNMTLADLLTCVVYMLTRPYLTTFPVGFCYPYYVMIFTFQLCSCLNLLWLNMDKLIYIQLPLAYWTVVTRRRARIISFCSWLLLLSLGSFLYSFMQVEKPCHDVLIPPLVYLPVCIMYISMIVASFAISAIIYCIANSSRRMEASAKTKLFQRLFFVFSSTLWTFLTCLPYRLLYLTNVLCESCRDSVVFNWFGEVFFRILVIGITVNPLITIVTQRQYRECILDTARRFLLLFDIKTGKYRRRVAKHSEVSADRVRSRRNNCSESRRSNHQKKSCIDRQSSLLSATDNRRHAETENNYSSEEKNGGFNNNNMITANNTFLSSIEDLRYADDLSLSF